LRFRLANGPLSLRCTSSLCMALVTSSSAMTSIEAINADGSYTRRRHNALAGRRVTCRSRCVQTPAI
jgi:hypothetical protein